MLSEQATRDELRAVAQQVTPDVEAMALRVTTTARRQRQRRNLGLAAAAAAVGVAGVLWGAGSLGWVTGRGDVQPVEQPGEWPIEWDGDWVRVQDPDLRRNRVFTTVHEIDGRLVAFGPGEVPILTSTDGIDWTPVDTPEASLSGAIRGGPGLIAFGATPDGRPAVWTSTDGLAWNPVEDPDGVFDDASHDLSWPHDGINAIAVGGPGFVAVGSSDNKPTVWTSADGLDWSPPQRVTSRSGRLSTVTPRGPELIVKGMVDLDPNASTDPEFGPAAWASLDGGASWSRATHDAVGEDADADTWVEGVIAAGPRFVAFGWGGIVDKTLLWTSDDGETWERVPAEQRGLDGWANRVVSAGGELVAVGSRYTGAAVWTSVDATTWESISDEPASAWPLGAGAIHDIIATETGVVAVGDRDTAAVWVMRRP